MGGPGGPWPPLGKMSAGQMSQQGKTNHIALNVTNALILTFVLSKKASVQRNLTHYTKVESS